MNEMHVWERLNNKKKSPSTLSLCFCVHISQVKILLKIKIFSKTVKSLSSLQHFSFKHSNINIIDV